MASDYKQVNVEVSPELFNDLNSELENAGVTKQYLIPLLIEKWIIDRKLARIQDDATHVKFVRSE